MEEKRIKVIYTYEFKESKFNEIIRDFYLDNNDPKELLQELLDDVGINQIKSYTSATSYEIKEDN